MKNGKIKENRNTLLLTAYCFKVLLDKVLIKFKSKYKDVSLSKKTQLFGFGNYDASKPNLCGELENIVGGFINGKYLYDKSLELKSGKPQIKLNGYYKIVLFQYLDYEDVEMFTENEIHEKEEKEKQLNLIKSNPHNNTYYYVQYHFGEDKTIIKSQVTILNGWKNAKYKYIYYKRDGSVEEFHFHGTIIKRADTLHIKTKTLLGNKMVEAGEDILYIGHTEPGSSTFLIGTYSGFDIYNRLIAGKLIFEKCATKEEMIKKSTTKKTPAYIVQEIRNQRITNKGVVPDEITGISSKSPFSSVYEKIPGKYECHLFQIEKKLGTFKFDVDQQSFKIQTLTEGTVITNDSFEIIKNGSVIHFSFQITGMNLFSNLEIFLKTYYLNRGEKDIEGVYSGLDIENRLISGIVKVDYSI